MRQKIVAGNWKMNKTVPEAVALARAVRAQWDASMGVATALCPAFPALVPVAEILKGSEISLGAQNAHWEDSGAFTGEVSVSMLASAGCRVVILGHSERRQLFGETDETVNRRLKAVLAAGLLPIVCVGETLAERDANRVEEALGRQVRGGLAELSAKDMGGLALAYEPVWAIGTGRNATPDQAQEAHAYIRSVLAELVGAGISATVPIQYGGSVKPSNAKDLFSQPDIDGGLIGGAALDADSFLGIVRAAG